MANGIYTAVSGAITQIHRMDVMANNLANVRTPGFKAEDVALHDVEASGDGRDGTRGQDARTYSQVADTFVRHDSGELYETSNPLDLAIRGNDSRCTAS